MIIEKIKEELKKLNENNEVVEKIKEKIRGLNEEDIKRIEKSFLILLYKNKSCRNPEVFFEGDSLFRKWLSLAVRGEKFLYDFVENFELEAQHTANFVFLFILYYILENKFKKEEFNFFDEDPFFYLRLHLFTLFFEYLPKGKIIFTDDRKYNLSPFDELIQIPHIIFFDGEVDYSEYNDGFYYYFSFFFEDFKEFIMKNFDFSFLLEEEREEIVKALSKIFFEKVRALSVFYAEKIEEKFIIFRGEKGKKFQQNYKEIYRIFCRRVKEAIEKKKIENEEIKLIDKELKEKLKEIL